MNQDRYPVVVGPASRIFEFVSEGPKGKIGKVIIFSTTNLHNLYNLGFGDIDPMTGDLSDDIVTNNGDSMKVLATVAGAVFDFTNEYPDAIVFATGNTPAKTRLYRMGITNNLEAILADFDVKGLIGEDWYPFEKGVAYDAFYVRRKA